MLRRFDLIIVFEGSRKKKKDCLRDTLGILSLIHFQTSHNGQSRYYQPYLPFVQLNLDLVKTYKKFFFVDRSLLIFFSPFCFRLFFFDVMLIVSPSLSLCVAPQSLFPLTFFLPTYFTGFFLYFFCFFSFFYHNFKGAHIVFIFFPRQVQFVARNCETKKRNWIEEFNSWTKTRSLVVVLSFSVN